MDAQLNRLDQAGRRIGPWEETFADGRPSATGSYVDGAKSGEWKYLFRNSKLKAIGTYDAGEMSGDWEWYRQKRHAAAARRLRGRAADRDLAALPRQRPAHG